MFDGKGGACARALRTERRGPGLILSANVEEEAISGPCNQCVSIRCMSSAAFGSAAKCGAEFGGVYLDYTWPLNYFEQQHCLLSQEVCTLDGIWKNSLRRPWNAFSERARQRL